MKKPIFAETMCVFPGDPDYDDADMTLCDRCGGEGTVEDFSSGENKLVSCPACKGQGKWANQFAAASQHNTPTIQPVSSDAGSTRKEP